MEEIVGGTQSIDCSCFGLDVNGSLSDDRYFVFYNQQRSPESAVAFVTEPAPSGADFAIDLDLLPDSIDRLAFVVTVDGEGAMSEITAGTMTLGARGGEPAATFEFGGSDFTVERAVIVGELYRHDGWRVAAVAQGFQGGLDAMLVHFGGEVVDNGSLPTNGGVPTPSGDLGLRGEPAPAGTDSAQGGDPAAPATPEARTPRRAAPSLTPKWEQLARERLRAAIGRARKPLGDLVARDANESDTRMFITDFLCDGLGYDKYADLSTEYTVRGEYADHAIRFDRQVVAFVEVKRASTKLSDRHLRQIQLYAVNEGVEWMILTNGPIWQVWHLTPGMPVEVDLAIKVDLLDGSSIEAKITDLFWLTKESLRRRQIDKLWSAQHATSGRMLAEVLCTPVVVETIRRELRRNTGHSVPAEEVRSLLRDTVIRAEHLRS